MEKDDIISAKFRDLEEIFKHKKSPQQFAGNLSN
jgi:hypothetical protein